MRFYLDEHFSPTIAEIARGLGLDVVSAVELGRAGLSDEEHLRLATQAGRCRVTKDHDDFLELTRRFYTEQRPHAGVLIIPRSIPGSRFAQIAHALRDYAAQRGNASSDYLLDYLRSPRWTGGVRLERRALLLERLDRVAEAGAGPLGDAIADFGDGAELLPIAPDGKLRAADSLRRTRRPPPAARPPGPSRRARRGPRCPAPPRPGRDA